MSMRNLISYLLTDPATFPNAHDLDALLRTHPARPCGKLELRTLGWWSVLGAKEELYALPAGDFILIHLVRHVRLLPASVINQAVEDRAAKLEQEQDRKVGRKERRDIKEELFPELLGQSFIKASRTAALIDLAAGRIYIDASSSTTAEELLGQLRETLGTLPVRPLTMANAPGVVMTSWLGDPKHLPQHFVLGGDCHLVGTEDSGGGSARIKDTDLEGAEVRKHLDAGKQAAMVALIWQDRVSCNLTDALGVRKLKFLEQVQEARADINAESERERLEADIRIEGAEIRALMAGIEAAMGGLADAE